MIRLLHPGGKTYWLAPDTTIAAELVEEAGFRYADEGTHEASTPEGVDSAHSLERGVGVTDTPEGMQTSHTPEGEVREAYPVKGVHTVDALSEEEPAPGATGTGQTITPEGEQA
jgi:hypothetical protein